MPNIDVVEAPVATCCRCDAPAMYTVYYDITVGVFAQGAEPRFCAAHNEELCLMSDDQRREVLSGFPLSASQTLQSALGDGPRPVAIRGRA